MKDIGEWETRLLISFLNLYRRDSEICGEFYGRVLDEFKKRMPLMAMLYIEEDE